MSQKPLVIKVNESNIPNGSLGQWADLAERNIQQFIENIQTPVYDASADLSAQVSGIPTAYARADLFKSALLAYGKSKDESNQNLGEYYKALSSEWRGLIACIALDYSRLKMRRVYLRYSDGKDYKDTLNVYEPKGSFGNMLFNSKLLWCDKDEASEDLKGVPFIDIIKYDDMVVGATSPESLLFTSCAYKISNTEDRPWVDYTSKRFVDPVPGKVLDKTRTLQLYAYVDYLIEGVNGQSGVRGLQTYYSALAAGSNGSVAAPNYNTVLGNLEAWREEIKAYAAGKGFKLEEASVPPVNFFKHPFDIAFNYEDKLYGLEGDLASASIEGGIEFSPKELLLDSKAKIARLIFKGPDKNDYSQYPVNVLVADVKGEPGSKACFALPLSPKGIKVFGRNIGDLVNHSTASGSTAISSRLTAEYDPNSETGNLEVTLHIGLRDGRTMEMKETYTCGGRIDGKKLIMWPNFISKQWHRYFMYSELPHNVEHRDYAFQAVPFIGDELDDLSTIERDGEPLYIAADGRDVDYDFTDKNGNERHVETSLHVVANSAVADNQYKYEIYECNHPFKGVKLRLPNGTDAGFLIVRYTTDQNNQKLARNLLAIQSDRLREATLGVDFGSTNTSIAYLDSRDQKTYGIDFANRRMSLLAAGERADNDVATEDRLFFFQAEQLLSNSIKSTLTLHDQRRVNGDGNESRDMAKFEKEVKGGFPCFGRNLPISSIDKNSQFVRLMTPKIGVVEQVYNMKWDDDERNIAYKEAFLRTLLLSIYAELFARGLYPRKLKWSYPSSMNNSLLMRYDKIWKSLVNVNPLKDVNNHKMLNGESTYGLSISTYGLGTAQDGNAFGAQAIGGGNSLLGGGGNPLGGGLFNNSLLGGQQPQQQQSFGSNPLLGGTAMNQESQQDGNGEIRFEKDDDTQSISFSPVPLVNENDFQSMTEASAVANYLASQRVGVGNDNTLTICFDIGGSTTDISALCELQQGTTMIKQNSIRFAAQLVSGACGKCGDRFKDVLLRTCDEFGLHIEGLNRGEPRYSDDTAAYYFEQMVDKLDASQLPTFYNNIKVDCGGLMCVDVYVTGLILYYAGILARKLIKQVRASKDCRWDRLPQVYISFAGKGARIMEWLGVVNRDLSNQYYEAMFIKGLGMADAQQLISGIKITFPEHTDDIKFEVSKGLAMMNTQLKKPKDSEPIEVIGEEGFFIKDEQGNRVTLDADNKITADMLACLGKEFGGSSSAGPRFADFLGLFHQVAQQYLGTNIRLEDMKRAVGNMELLSFIRNTPDYLRARQADKFDFVAPILILEGLEFYEDFLLKNIKQ